MVTDIFFDKVFAKQVLAAENEEEILALLQENGYDVDPEDVPAICQLIEKIESGEITRKNLKDLFVTTSDGELSDEMLEAVSGGLFSGFKNFIKIILNKIRSAANSSDLPSNGSHKLG